MQTSNLQILQAAEVELSIPSYDQIGNGKFDEYENQIKAIAQWKIKRLRICYIVVMKLKMKERTFFTIFKK